MTVTAGQKKGSAMKKAVVLFSISLAIVASAAPVAAQPAKEMPLIGYLNKSSKAVFLGEHFRQGLRDLGYVEGRNIKILFRNAEGRPERFPELIADLIRRKVDVIVTAGGPPLQAAMRATRTIPIVCTVSMHLLSDSSIC